MKIDRHPLLGLGLAFLFLGSQLASFTHLLLVKHATCPEHGELVHLDEAGVVVIRREVPEPGVGWSVASSIESGHRHDHCLCSTSRRERVLTPASRPPLTIARAGLVTAPAERAVSSLPSLLLLRLAPKSSPPV